MSSIDEAEVKHGDEPIGYSMLDQVCSQLDADQAGALTRKIFSMFLEDSAGQDAGGRRALLEQCQDALEHFAHTLKGSSAYVGAHQLSALAAAIEQAAHAPDFAKATAQFIRLEVEMDAVRTALTARLSA